MAYTPSNPPAAWDPQWMAKELQNLARESQAAVNGVMLDTQYTAPGRIYEGLTVLADGTQWNPGAGQGVYTYYAGSWKKLG